MGDTEGAGYELDYIPIMVLVWGKGFIAPGGEGNVDRIVEGVDLRCKRVLDRVFDAPRDLVWRALNLVLQSGDLRTGYFRGHRPD